MRKLICLIITLIFSIGIVESAYAGGGVPYLGYTYDHWGNVVPSPAAYVPRISIGGPDIDPSIGHFRSPEDMFVDANGDIYLLDTGNNRVVIFDKALNLRMVIDSFMMDGVEQRFNNPFGITVSRTFNIYIADTENRRVVVLDPEGNFVKQYTDPQNEAIDDNFVFLPIKVAVDPAGRMFTIVRNVFEGIMSFDTDGSFIRYFGTINVSPNPIDWFWRQFATQAQKDNQILFIPVEFQSMDIDSAGFVYTTNIEAWDSANKVKRLNPSGEDVLINYSSLSIVGDQSYRPAGRLGGNSSFTDVKARPNGMYSALCTSRSRLFTYDSEGNLLYIIAGTGNALGMGRFPTAVEVLDDDILILDRQRGEIVYFEETEYGKLINQAIALRYDGDESAAVAKWEEVLKLNENYTLAYNGIGKALLASGENEEAMEYLKKGMDVLNYSVAYRRYRNEYLKDNLNMVLTLVSIVLLVYVIFKLYKANIQRKARIQAELAENEARAARLKRQSTDIIKNHQEG